MADAPGPGWPPLTDDLARRRAAARAMGGPERLARQRAGGRLDARARVAALCDPDTFRELGTLVGADVAAPADAFVCGLGRVDGRPVLVGAEDFTVLGGSIGLRAHAKRHRLAELALQERVPLVLLLDGAGERAQNALERYPRAPHDLQAVARLSGLVPTVAVVMGPAAGHSAVLAPLADLLVMVEGAAAFVAGPALVTAATGEVTGKDALGGTGVHAASGLAHLLAADDFAALGLVRRWLGHFPSSAWELPPRRDGGDAGPRPLDELEAVLPTDQRRPYDVRRVLALLVDDGELLEVQGGYGDAICVALARLGGHPVALVASQPLVGAGAIDGPAAEKAARFVELADAFQLPLVFLADTPGVIVGAAAERAGTLRRAMRLYAAQVAARTPKLHVTLRKAYGVASCLMAMNPFDGQTLALALPTARLGAMPAGGAGAVAGADGDAAAELAAAEALGPYRPADSMAYDEVIEPRELRDRLLDGVALACRRRDPGPVRRCAIRP